MLGYGLVLPASDFRRASEFWASFHSIVTLRMSWYAPPDTGVPNLQLVSVEYLPSIEGALEIQMNVTFLRGKAPLPGELSPKVTERLLHICGDLSVSASPSHLPWEGRPWGTHSNGFPYEGKAFGAYRSELISASGSALPCRPCRAGGIWGW